MIIMSKFNEDLRKIALLQEKRKVKTNDNTRPEKAKENRKENI